jgi:hypothetical protein
MRGDFSLVFAPNPEGTRHQVVFVQGSSAARCGRRIELNRALGIRIDSEATRMFDVAPSEYPVGTLVGSQQHPHPATDILRKAGSRRFRSSPTG